MRWLILTADLAPGFTGGIAAWAEDLAVALHEAGEEVEILARATGGTGAWDAARPFPVHRIRGRSWGRFQGELALLHAWPRLGAETVVIAATWRLATGLVGRLRGARLGVAFHGSDLTQLAEAPPGLMRVATAAHALLPVSHFLAGELRRLGVTAPSTVLPMPLAIPLAISSGPRAGLALVARPTGLKGAERALALAAALGEELTLVGGGTLAGARCLGALPRVEALAVLGAARAAVLLPRVEADGRGAEGLGLCLLEAAARGTPVIGCRTGGVPEAAGPGLLLEDPDAPEVGAVRAWLADPDQGARARAWVEGAHGGPRAVAVLRARFAD